MDVDSTISQTPVPVLQSSDFFNVLWQLHLSLVLLPHTFIKSLAHVLGNLLLGIGSLLLCSSKAFISEASPFSSAFPHRPRALILCITWWPLAGLAQVSHGIVWIGRDLLKAV